MLRESPLVELIGFLREIEPDSPQWAAWWEKRNALLAAASTELAGLVKDRDAWREAAYHAAGALEMMLLPIPSLATRFEVARRNAHDFEDMAVVKADAPRVAQETAQWEAERARGMEDLREAFGVEELK